MTKPTEDLAPKSSQKMSRSERIFVRISIWQTVLSLVGVFIAVVALYAALTESEAVRRQTAAAVWPYVQLSVNDFVEGENGLFELSLTNAGVGPANIRAVRVTFNGETKTSWRDVVLATGGGEPMEFAQNAANNRVVRPGERISIFRTTDLRLVARMRSAVTDPSNAIEYCYCSIFEECWLADSRQQNVRPQAIAQCPDYGADDFQN